MKFYKEGWTPIIRTSAGSLAPVSRLFPWPIQRSPGRPPAHPPVSLCRAHGSAAASRPWPAARWGAFLVLIALGLFLAEQAPAAQPGIPVQPGNTSRALAILPVEDLRSPEAREEWLGLFLRERMTAAFQGDPRVWVVSGEVTRHWRSRFSLRAMDVPARERLDHLGPHTVIVGTTQQVLGLAQIRLQVHERENAPEVIRTLSLQFHLRRDGPEKALRGLYVEMGAVFPRHRLRRGKPLAESWDSVRGLYTLLARGPVGRGPSARPALSEKLTPFLRHPGLQGRVHEALARLWLEQTLLHHPRGPRRPALLQKARAHARAAFQANPEDTHLQALKGEIHFFLGEYFEAKTEASIARLKNPLNELAYMVLALNAGLSTGESNEHMGRALAIAPFMMPTGRLPDTPPYQGGALDSYLKKWKRLQGSRGLIATSDYRGLMDQGRAHFENQEWEEAQDKFDQAARLEEEDYTPWLYQYRIMILTGRATEAIPELRRLATDNPTQGDILHYLGVALEEGGEFPEAAEAFRGALRETPGAAESRFHLARVQMAEAGWPEALTTLRTLLNDHPRHDGGWAKLGTVQLRMKEREAAQSAFAKALNLNPENQEARRGLARLGEGTTAMAKPATGRNAGPGNPRAGKPAEEPKDAEPR